MAVSRITQKDVGDFLECRVGQGDRQILLLGHMDTVFSSGTAKIRSFIKKGDLIYGPGVLDMKGGIVVLLFAIKNIINVLPKNTKLLVFLNTDEEIGSNYSKDYILKNARQSIACLSFESAKPGTLTTERKGIISFKMSVNGISSHSGVNYNMGKSAIKEIAYKVCDLYNLVDIEKDITVNVGTINGGQKVNIIADHAEAFIEIRYFNIGDGESLKRKIKNIINNNHVEGTWTNIEIISERMPLVSNERCEKLFDIAEYTAEKLGKEIKPRKTGGGGDVSFAAMCGIPVIDGLGPEGENSHTEKEFVNVDSIPFRIKLASQIILNIANGGL